MFELEPGRDEFNEMLRQKRQEGDLFRERELELGCLYAYTLREKDIPISEQGKIDARSITRQIALWKETLTSDRANRLFMFINIEKAVDEFHGYLKSKYKGKKREEWEAKFRSESYCQDVARLFYAKVYDHKYDLACNGIPAFASGQAHNEVHKIRNLRVQTEKMNEAVGRFSKVAKNNPELAQHPDWVKEEMLRVFREVLTETLPMIEAKGVPLMAITHKEELPCNPN